ncbi:hypothetical protein OIU76_027772 [Salix suchowensis]|nr:hypothetical protein OIU76_027772 [Salix suchowensis]
MERNGRDEIEVENGNYDLEDDRGCEKEEQKEELSVERMFEQQEVASWRNQLTLRAFVVSFMLSILFTVIVMKLNLTTGGFGNYLFGMSETVAKQSTEDRGPFKNPSLSWMIGFLFVVSFLGLFSVVPLRKVMIVDFKLTYPSGTATGHLINSFHTPTGAKLAKKQVRVLGKFLSLSFLWGFFQWFYTAGDSCGFADFPSLGLKAYENRFFFDFSATYVGVGMICPPQTRQLKWPPRLQGKFSNKVKVFIATALILGDGLYNFFKVLSRTLIALSSQLRRRNAISAGRSSPEISRVSYDEQRRNEFFLKDQIPTWFAVAGYVAIAAVSTATVPHIFPELKWYHILVIYIFAPALAFSNAYGCGLTDFSLAYSYGTLAIFAIGAWAGASHGGVLAGLAACGVMMNIVSTASDLSQDFKTGYLTLSSPRSMFVSQLIGTAMGCIISPCVFWLFLKAFKDLGTTGSEYPAPYATVFRNMAIMGGGRILVSAKELPLSLLWLLRRSYSDKFDQGCVG